MLALRPTLAHLLPISAVGLFSFASSIAAIPNLLSSAIDLALAPVYFRQRESSGSDEFHAKMLDFGSIYAAAMLPVWVFATLFCPEVIRLIAGPRYAGAAPVCAILLCASFVRFQLPFLLRQIHFMRKTWLQPAITIPWGLVPIVLTVLFSRRYGIAVAGWSTLAAEFGIIVSYALAIRRHEQIGYPIATGLFFIGILALLAAWVANQADRADWHVIAVKLGCVFLASATSFAIWIWPKRRLVLQLASG
jgi:O-antigen/teichoic acid export membrane protein